MNRRPRAHTILPGFGLTMGLTILWLSLIVLIPLSALFVTTAQLSWERFIEVVSGARALASYRLTILAALAGASINSVFGFIVAWVLVRYRFPGRRLVDALVDLPFALPTAVSGIALAAVWARNGWIGQFLEPLGLRVAFTPLGVVMALTLIGLPFVVRTLQPAIEDLERESEEAASSLGAGRAQTLARVILPALAPAMLTGFALAFARALGEYGSVIFISGNMPFRTEITSLLIVIHLEEYDYAAATAIAVVMLAAAFAMLMTVNLLQWWSARRYAAE